MLTWTWNKEGLETKSDQVEESQETAVDIMAGLGGSGLGWDTAHVMWLVCIIIIIINYFVHNNYYYNSIFVQCTMKKKNN